jgi:glycosyltransferase involved in cell wall biosynthesis
VTSSTAGRPWRRPARRGWHCLLTVIRGQPPSIIPSAPERASRIALADREVETMANGTPVVALARGAAPEVIEDGVTGLLADNVHELVRAVHDAGRLDPRRCANRTRDGFSAQRMVEAYLRIYREVLGGK